MCFGAFSLHAAPDGAGYSETGSYKHVAPTEQEPSITNDDDFSGKAALDRNNNGSVMRLDASAFCEFGLISSRSKLSLT